MNVKDQNITYNEAEKIKEIIEKIDSGEINSLRNSIGLLKEKILHKTLKYYHEPDEKYHEYTINSFVADIYKDGNVTEIQTGNFRAVREKIQCYLADENIKSVLFVYPIKSVRHLCWINKETGEMSKTTRSAKFNDIFSIYHEIYYLKDFLGKEKFTLKVMLLEVTEVKILDGWSKDKKKGATKVEAIPKSVIKTYTLHNKESLKSLFPTQIFDKKEFTSKDLTLYSGIKGKDLYSFLKVMRECGVIEKSGKKSRLDIYKIITS